MLAAITEFWSLLPLAGQVLLTLFLVGSILGIVVRSHRRRAQLAKRLDP